MTTIERNPANKAIPIALAVVALIVWSNASDAYGSPPVKQVVSAHYGAEVNKKGGNVCVVGAGNECQAGKESASAGGFTFPAGVAVDPATGEIFVADTNNNRVERLATDGSFIAMFGWEVNSTKDKTQASQTEKNVCTAASGDVCQAGTAGALPGQMKLPHGITVDGEGHVFVQDGGNARIEEFTAEGELLLMIGGEVNKTNTEKGSSVVEDDLCTVASGDVCQGGTRWDGTTPVPGAFNFAQASGNLMAVGGPEGLLYVGDEHRVQEFSASTGMWVREISLSGISSEKESTVPALALDESCELHQPPLTEATNPSCNEFDPEYGSLFVVYEVKGEADLLRKYSVSGTEISDEHFPLRLSARDPAGDLFRIKTVTVDLSGRLAIAESESLAQGGFTPFGALYDGSTGRMITEFAVPSLVQGLAFDRSENLFAAATNNHEIVAYRQVPVAELAPEPASCSYETEIGTNVSFDCVLAGNVNPRGVPKTEAWFEWGGSSRMGEKTPVQEVGASEQLHALLAGMLPNALVYFRLAAYDENVVPPEGALTSETASFLTPYTSPRALGVPIPSFVEPFSVVLYGEVNPENADTRFDIEYAAEQNAGETLANKCPHGVRQEQAKCEAAGVLVTSLLRSEAYGAASFTQEVGNLNPATKYRARIFAESESRDRRQAGHVEGEESEFDTPSLPSIHVETGLYEELTTTGAVVFGTVDTGGQPAFYDFELGLYSGAATEYDPVATGSVLPGTGPAVESTVLSGLQPNTVYAYRIVAGTGREAVYGQPVVFRTLGGPVLPEFVGPPQVPVPMWHFPGKPKCKHGYRRSANERCIKTRARAKKHARRQTRHKKTK